MAIRWSKKARRFYDDQTGYPVSQSRGFRSSIGRADYARATRKRTVKRRGKKPVKARVKTDRSVGRGIEYSPGYYVRQLDEEFAEELTQFDGTLDEEMDFDDYMEFLGDDQAEVMDADDSYSED